MAAWIIRHPSYLPPLLGHALGPDEALSIKAWYTLDLVTDGYPEHIYPHVDTLVAGVTLLTCESAVRPASRICEALLKAVSRNEIRLTPLQQERLAETSFDWLLGEYGVATHVFAMSCLFYLGLQIRWIHSELEGILKQKLPFARPGYRVRVLRILRVMREGGQRIP